MPTARYQMPDPVSCRGGALERRCAGSSRRLGVPPFWGGSRPGCRIAGQRPAPQPVRRPEACTTAGPQAGGLHHSRSAGRRSAPQPRRRNGQPCYRRDRKEAVPPRRGPTPWGRGRGGVPADLADVLTPNRPGKIRTEGRSELSQPQSASELAPVCVRRTGRHSTSWRPGGAALPRQASWSTAVLCRFAAANSTPGRQDTGLMGWCRFFVSLLGRYHAGRGPGALLRERGCPARRGHPSRAEDPRVLRGTQGPDARPHPAGRGTG